jgi:hypothetical protein
MRILANQENFRIVASRNPIVSGESGPAIIAHYQPSWTVSELEDR